MKNLLTNRSIPGITGKGVEFYQIEESIKMLYNGGIKDFIEMPPIIIDIIKKEINSNPDVKSELERLHPDSEILQLHKFIKCRFGGLDHTPDILNGKLQDSEYWSCPIRENCVSKGILCKKASYQGTELDWTDLELMKLLTTDKTNEVIAAELNIPLGSFHSKKKRIYEIFKISTKQEITIICMLLNYI